MTVEATWMTWPGPDGEFHDGIMELTTAEDVDRFIAANADPAADVARLMHWDRVRYIYEDGERLQDPDHEVYAAVYDGLGYLSFQGAEEGKQYAVGGPDSPGGQFEDDTFPAGTGLALALFKQAIVEFISTAHKPTCVQWWNRYAPDGSYRTSLSLPLHGDDRR